MEERRVISTLQETFIKQISELSNAVGQLNVSMTVHRGMMLEIKENQKEYTRLMLIVERNNVKIDDALVSISKLDERHNKCSIHDVEKKVESLDSKVSMIAKVIGVMGAGLVPVIYKLFGG